MIGIAAVLVQRERLPFHRDVADLGIETLVVVEEDVEDALLEDALFGVFEQVGEGQPPRILEVLRLVHDDGVEQLVLCAGVGRVDDFEAVHEQVGGFFACQPCCARHPDGSTARAGVIRLGALVRLWCGGSWAS
jgi:hypothetical protein